MTAPAELGVTPAAVSQQVRHLEDFLGRKLFTRLNNRIVLTDAGRAIYAGITPALEDISALTTRVMSGSTRSKLVVSVIPSLAECWFMPAFAAYAAGGASIRIDLRIEEDPVDFASGEIDLRVCYGSAQYPDFQTVQLFRDEVIPLCCPDLAARVSLQTADDGDFIHTNWGRSFASNPSWGEWFKRHQPSRSIDATKGHRAGSSQLALEFACRGLGIALGQRALAHELIKAGKLVPMQDESLPLGHDYCAVYPLIKARRPGLRELTAFLQTRVPRPQ